MFNRGHLLQLLYLVHDELIRSYQHNAAARVMDLIQDIKQMPDHEIKNMLEEYKPNTLVNIILGVDHE